MIAIIDYGAGNLFSVKNALDFLDAENMIADRPEALELADALILPGVGAFPDAMRRLHASGLETAIQAQAQKKPLLGICLGMQMLFDSSNEFEETAGLGLISGTVRRLAAGGLKIPHMGWNDLTVLHPCALTKGLKGGEFAYFVHSFAAQTDDANISCYTVYGEHVPALVHSGKIYGAQFHPEKSGQAGLQMLRNFAELAGKTK